jgi:hypothetical protein
LKELSGLSNPIYVAIDGPRTNQDLESAAEIVRIIENSDLNIVEIRKNDVNVGTYNVADAIGWVLEDNYSLIIIEEDDLVSKDFVYFAESMLRKYEPDNRIGSISAMNSVPQSSISHP